MAETSLTTANNVLLPHGGTSESIRKQRGEEACDGTTLCVGVSLGCQGPVTNNHENSDTCWDYVSGI